MKLTNIKSNKARKGMTLLELTVVILVLLSLIAVLLIGVQAWMRSADRGNAAMIVRNAQQGARGQCNLFGIDSTTTAKVYTTEYIDMVDPAGPPLPLNEEVFAPEGYVVVDPGEEGTPPEHPQDGNAFIFGSGADTLPPLGSMYIESQNDASFFRPQNIE